MEKFLAGLVVTLIVMALGLLLGVYNAWLFVDMWQWFVVPLGMKPLTLWMAYGLLMVVAWPLAGTMSRVQQTYDKVTSDGTKRSYLESLGNAFAWVIAISFGYTVTFWFGKLIHLYLM